MTNRASVDFGPWETLPGKDPELNRTYDFTNLGGPGTKTRIELRCRLCVEEESSRGFFGFSKRKVVKPFVYLVVNPYILEQTKIVIAMFAPSDDLAGYDVLMAKVEAAATGVNFIVFDISNGEQLLKVLSLGKQITMRLIDPPAETIGLVALENDLSFAAKYHSLKNQLLS